MDNELKVCTNIVKCIGAISEINVEFIKKDNGDVNIRGSIVLSINDDYIKFNIFTSKKMNERYYNIIETLGIPYSFISNIDKDEYKINVNPITVGMVGSAKIIENDTIVKKVDFNQSNNPTKLFIISNLSQYGNQSTYVSRVEGKKSDAINVLLQGILYKMDKDYIHFVLTSKNSDIKIIKLSYDKDIVNKVKSIKQFSLYDLSLKWDKGFDIQDNIVVGSRIVGYKLIDISPTDDICDKDKIKTLVQIYNINHKLI